MEVQFNKQAASTEEMLIRFEPDINAGGPTIISNYIDYSNDAIYKSLTAANQQAYSALPFGSYLKISSTEYTNLQNNLTNVTMAGVTDTTFTNIGNATSVSGGFGGAPGLFTNVVNAAGTPAIPANSFVIAVAFYYAAVTNSSIRIFANNSTSSYTNFQQIGGVLPTTTAVAYNYYVLKGATSVTASTSGNLAYWIDTNSYFSWKSSVVNTSGVRYFQTGTFANPTLPTSATTLSSTFPSGAFGLQGITTTVKQWVA